MKVYSHLGLKTDSDRGSVNAIDSKGFMFIAWNYNTNGNKNVRKSLVICETQFAGGLLLKMLNIFEFSHVKEIAES